MYFASESRVRGFWRVYSKLYVECAEAIVRRLSGFSLSFQKLGFSLAKRENPASPVEAQEGRYQWFPPSDFLPFPKIIWCKPETGDRCEKGERQRIFSFVSFSNYSQCQIPCCYTGGFISAGAAQGELPARAREGPLGDDRDAQLVGLVATDGTCEFRCLISFILAGAVYHNTLTICATRLCRACTDSPTCVAVHYPILRKGKIKGRT